MFGLTKEKPFSIEREVKLNNTEYKLKIHFEKRRNSRASISRNGINIRIPIFLGRDEREREIKKLTKWAIEKIAEHPDKFSKEPPVEYQNGKNVVIAGLTYQLNILEGERTKTFAKLHENTIEIRIPEGSSDKTGKILCRLVAKEFLPFVKRRIEELNDIHYKKHLGKVSLKNNKSTWGSCMPNGDISIATKLLLAPREIMDYVFIHELAHLVVRGHSKKFWMAVEKALPDYKQKRKWLRKNSSLVRF